MEVLTWESKTSPIRKHRVRLPSFLFQGDHALPRNSVTAESYEHYKNKQERQVKHFVSLESIWIEVREKFDERHRDTASSLYELLKKQVKRILEAIELLCTHLLARNAYRSLEGFLKKLSIVGEACPSPIVVILAELGQLGVEVTETNKIMALGIYLDVMTHASEQLLASFLREYICLLPLETVLLVRIREIRQMIVYSELVKTCFRDTLLRLSSSYDELFAMKPEELGTILARKVYEQVTSDRTMKKILRRPRSRSCFK